ncbi:hypothetical protein YpsIP31758_2499 [Yersinia pseudotuberculosis IP 31758]|uniref:Uncharacterized protein n=1 Tax=Yersinia pseudotuberculosis serotype O:1b (strain IP 31758) TaxID=349747 RepID=A0A0U1QY01_YERP3|nr:hypothetical protein YpsIP31758_2499 [Yersinia pseudotuberculosis IP 31758]
MFFESIFSSGFGCISAFAEKQIINIAEIIFFIFIMFSLNYFLQVFLKNMFLASLEISILLEPQGRSRKRSISR